MVSYKLKLSLTLLLLFFWAAKTAEEVMQNGDKWVPKQLCLIVVIPFCGLVRFLFFFFFLQDYAAQRIKQLALLFLFFSSFFFYSDALQSLDHVLFITDSEWPWLPMPWGMTKCNHYSVFGHFCFDFFQFDKLENNFLLYMNLSIHIYIYTNIYIYIMSISKRFCFRYLLLWT